jgi:hypothetical protein
VGRVGRGYFLTRLLRPMANMPPPFAFPQSFPQSGSPRSLLKGVEVRGNSGIVSYWDSGWGKAKGWGWPGERGWNRRKD